MDDATPPSIRPWYERAQLRINEVVYAPRTHRETHAHPEAFVCFVLRGGFAETVGTQTMETAPGVLHYLPPAVEHRDRFSNAGMRCLRVEVSPEWLSRNVAVRPSETTRTSLIAGGPRSWRCLQLYRQCVVGAPFELEVEAEIALLFEDLVGRTARPSFHPPKWLAAVRDALESSPKARSLADLATIAGVHASHLTRVFLDHYGCSIGEYVQTRRIALASRMLLETRRPLASVAGALGYYDQSHFTRAFKMRVGMTPGQYRAAAGEDRRRDEDAPIVQDEIAWQGAS
jgi:AraC family transcriptional regulator